MKKLIVVIAMIASMLFAGCVSFPPATPEQIQDLRIANDRYISALKNETLAFDCANKKICDKAFSLTKVYINKHSDMRIQHSDDTTVSTFNPNQRGLVGMTASKIPGIGDAAMIELQASCSDLEGEQYVLNNPSSMIGADIAFKHPCMTKLADIYETFKPYVESRLK